MLSIPDSRNNIRYWWMIFTLVVVASLVLGGCSAPKPKVYRVGILSSNPNFAVISDGFKAKMTELGYTENENIIYVLQEAKPDQADRELQAKKLVDEKVDLIFVSGSPDSLAAKAATQGTNIPVVFAYGQLEGTNLVNSVREPGGNITGVRYPGPEMISKRLTILHEIVPTAKRVWICYDKNGPNAPTALGALRPTAESLGITLVEVPITSIEEIGADLNERAQAADLGLDAMLTMPDEFNTSTAGFTAMSEFASVHKIPLAGGIGFMAKQGAIFVNTTNLANVGGLAAPLADKILKGTAAGTIPVVTPEQTLTINYQVAEALGIAVPEGLLKQAGEIIR